MQVEDVRKKQAELYQSPLAATLDEYIRTMDSVRIAMAYRCVRPQCRRRWKILP